MKRIHKMIALVLGLGMIGVTANAQLTVTGGDLLIPNETASLAVILGNVQDLIDGKLNP